MAGLGRSCRSTRRAESRHSLRLQTQLGNMMKADTRGRDQFFRCADAANGGSEPRPKASAHWSRCSLCRQPTFDWGHPLRSPDPAGWVAMLNAWLLSVVALYFCVLMALSR